MMLRVRFLLCFVIGVCSTQKPIEFTCDNASGNITIQLDGNTMFRSIYALGTKAASSTDHELCSVKDPPPDHAGKYEITDCILDHPITVFLMTVPDQNQNKGRYMSNDTKQAEAFIIGGQSFSAYSLECFKDTPIDAQHPLLHDHIGIAVTAIVPTATPKSTVTLSEGSVYIEMWIQQLNGNTLLPTTEIIVGDSLLIVISGPAGPAYHVNECIAYDPQKESKTSIRLAYDKTTKRSELMTGFVKASATENNLTKCGTKFCIKSTLYAFHFKDSNDVTFKCSMEVCKDLSGNCDSSNSFNGSNTNNGRRRRDSNVQLYELKTTFLVKDRFPKRTVWTINQGHTLRSTFYLLETFAAVWVIIRFA